MNTQSSIKMTLMALAAVMPSIIHAANIDVVATQTVNTTPFGTNVRAITSNTTWTKDNNYILSDKVFVTNGATLTIEPGTKIYSTLDDKGTGTKDDDAFGAIVITRGAKIQANGTAAEPIVMTTIDELEAQTDTDLDGNSTVADAPTATTAGRWGGLVILGNAPIANFGPGPVNIGEDRIEGFQPAASTDLDSDGRADVIEYGGNVAADNSGSITYVSIRHGGYVYAAATEINGLTLGGVGSGTTISHVEVFANADDGIEFFGGTVNTSNIILTFNQDDSFDIDQGYSGTNQFWFAIQNPFLEDGVTSAQDNGGEWDGVTGTINDSPAASSPTIYNATFIGSGVTGPLGTDRGNNALFIDDRFKGKIYNSVFDDFREDFIEASGDAFGTGLVFAHNTIGRFGGGTVGSNLTYLNGSGATNMVFDAAGAPINGNSNGGIDPMLSSYIRDAGLKLQSIDPRPSMGSPLLASNGATLQAGAPIAANFRGAFGATNWAAGWTRTSQAGLFQPKVDVIATQTVNTTPFGTNVRAITSNTTWTKNNIYILKDKVFVTNGATLTIEAGTKIYSTLDDKGTGTKDDDAFGAIVIVRGAKIQANGTAEEPIVMTTIDELEAQTGTDLDGNSVIADAPTMTTAGRWGGLVILGNAPIANFGPGPVNIGEDRIEGFQPAASTDLDSDGRADVIEYGGNVAADNSGSITYLSIRHGGYVYAAATEINGLTLGGVGSGTNISHVEVFANADDGIEFFGGTVNTSNIVLAFNQDDSFDIDQGYSGTNQFWFAIQNPFLADGVTSAQDNGGEWDGVTGTINDSPVASAPTIYNATFIGSGVTGPLGTDRGNNALFIDDRFKGKIYNSVFDDFREDFIEASSDGFGTGLVFAHNTIGRFGGGSYTGSNASNLSFLNGSGAANMVFDTAGAPLNGNSNGGVNPMYRNYTRDAGLVLTSIDPRPAPGSPLLSASIQPGAPTAANFRGAFGATNWAAGWTRLSMGGQLIGESGGGGAPPFADADNDGISDSVESANTSLGFNPSVNNGTPATIFNGLYTEASILDLRTAGQTTVQAVGPNVTLSLPVFKSGTLDNPWIPAGNLSLTIPKDGDKQFYRIQVEGAD